VTTKRSSAIHFLAELRDDGAAELGPILPAEGDDAWREGLEDVDGPEAVVELLDAKGTVLMRDVLVVQQPCLLPSPDGDRAPGPVLVAGRLPVLNDAVVVRLALHGETLVEHPVPADPPEVTVEWSGIEKAPDGPAEIWWESFHPTGAAVVHQLVAAIQRKHTPVDESADPEALDRVALTLPTSTTKFEIATGQLPAGTEFLELSSTDGFNTTTTRSGPLSIGPRSCVAVIVQPGDGSVHPAGAVRLVGSGYYPGVPDPEDMWLRWFGGNGEELALGATAEIEMTPGTHEIVLRAGRPGSEGKTSVTIEVMPSF